MQNNPTQEPFITCLSAQKFDENNRKYFMSQPGSYFVQVAAVSLAGPGEYTKEVLVIGEWMNYHG